MERQQLAFSQSHVLLPGRTFRRLSNAWIEQFNSNFLLKFKLTTLLHHSSGAKRNDFIQKLRQTVDVNDFEQLRQVMTENRRPNMEIAQPIQ